MKNKLTEADKYYIKHNWQTMILKELVENTGTKDTLIKKFIDECLTGEQEEVLGPIKPIMDKGASVMTQQASEFADDFRQLPKPKRDESHIHRCKEKPKNGS